MFMGSNAEITQYSYILQNVYTLFKKTVLSSLGHVPEFIQAKRRVIENEIHN